MTKKGVVGGIRDEHDARHSQEPRNNQPY
jgi:hypothetical protein